MTNFEKIKEELTVDTMVFILSHVCIIEGNFCGDCQFNDGGCCGLTEEKAYAWLNEEAGKNEE